MSHTKQVIPMMPDNISWIVEKVRVPMKSFALNIGPEIIQLDLTRHCGGRT